VFQSIYFFDPSGNRLELTAVTATPEQAKELRRVAPAMLKEWDRTKRPPRQAAWVHEKEFAQGESGIETECCCYRLMGATQPL
jgi:glyoxylase I family protein